MENSPQKTIEKNTKRDKNPQLGEKNERHQTRNGSSNTTIRKPRR